MQVAIKELSLLLSQSKEELKRAYESLNWHKTNIVETEKKIKNLEGDINQLNNALELLKGQTNAN